MGAAARRRAAWWRGTLLLAIVKGEIVLLQRRIIRKSARKTPEAVHWMRRWGDALDRRDGMDYTKARLVQRSTMTLWRRGQGRTKRSRASPPKDAFLGESFMVALMSINWASLLNSASKVCRKGLRDMGRLPALEGVCRAGEGKPGEVALLRNGLFELSSSDRPGEGRRSACTNRGG